MKCPKCGSENIQINESYNKKLDFTLKHKVFVIFIFILGLILSISFFSVNTTFGSIFFFAFLIWYIIYLKKKISKREKARKKSHSKCICKNCCNIWYLD